MAHFSALDFRLRNLLKTMLFSLQLALWYRLYLALVCSKHRLVGGDPNFSGDGTSPAGLRALFFQVYNPAASIVPYIAAIAILEGVQLMLGPRHRLCSIFLQEHLLRLSEAHNILCGHFQWAKLVNFLEFSTLLGKNAQAIKTRNRPRDGIST